MNCLLKKFVLKQANKVLANYKDNVQKTRQTVETWTNRAKAVVVCLESLSAKLVDNELDGKEIEEAANELKQLVEGWKS